MSTTAHANQQTIMPEEEPTVSRLRLTKRTAAIMVVGLSAVYLVSLLYRPPDGDYFTVCGFKTFTGLPCPGCGLTHSFCAIGKGDLTGAFTYNLVGPALFLFSLLIYLRSLFVLLGLWGAALAFDTGVARIRAVRLFVIAFTLYGLARIVFLTLHNPAIYHNSPLGHLLAWLAG